MAQQTRVLIIDDDQTILTVYKDLLGQHGYAVTTSGDGTTVVELLKSGSYDVILLDIRMPGIEGTDLLPLIKKLEPSVPVILVSAYCDETQRDYYASLGAAAAISKPFSREALLDTISRALNQEEGIPVVLRSLSLREGRDVVYRKLILSALRKTNWNQVHAAKLLGVSRHCLIRWVKRLGLAV
jgi:DNA-binding NtrC family response regulator